MIFADEGNAPIVCFQFTSNSIQIAASLEIIDSLTKEKTMPVKYFWLGASTKYPSPMARGLDSPLRRVQIFPKQLKRALYSLNSSGVEMYSKLDKQSAIASIREELMDQCKEFSEVQDLSKLQYGEILPGGALANSFVYETGKRTFDYSKDKSLVKLLLTSYLETYHGVVRVLKEQRPYRVVLYNGRFLHERAAWDACRHIGIDVYLFETTRNRFHVRVNQGFHDRVLNQVLMKEFWITKNRELDPTLLQELGSKYFTDLESSRNRFFAESKFNNLKRDYFVFYSNSDDEAIGFWDSWQEPFLDQIEVIGSLQTFFETNKDFHLYIRLHPNLVSKSQEEQARWSTLKSNENSTVIAATEQVSSYQLLKGARGVISFGSTIGLEAAYHLIPSAILADCWYDELGVADKLNSLEELTEWIESVDRGVYSNLLQERMRGALIRGLWMELAGNPFMNCKMDELSWGAWEVTHFKDVKLQRSWWGITMSILSNKAKRLRLGLKT